MSPILRLVIPIILGMIGAFLVHENISSTDIWLPSSIFAFALLLIVLYNLSNKNTRLIKWFALSSHILFCLIGLFFALHAIENAKQTHGEDWKRSVYTDNKFRIAKADSIQQSIHLWMQSKGIEGESGAIVEAMTIGVKSGISKERKTAFSRAGISHILALSGFHVGIIYVALQLLFLSRIVSRRWRWISHLLTIVALWSYAFIAGMSPSLVRAVIMCSVLIFNTVLSRQILSVNSLALSALVTLLIDPMLLLHVGFQLSYICMLAILFVGIPLTRLYQGFCIVDRFFWATICITISCSLFTLPVVSYTFGQIPLLSVFSNIYATVLTYLIFIIFFLWLISGAATALTIPLLATSGYLTTITDKISAYSFASIQYHMPLPAVILYYCILCSLLLIAYRKKKQKI